jgi:glucosamine 6-phosphate synthetase-like amidotransferase/phosphosugar isomerase protein
MLALGQMDRGKLGTGIAYTCSKGIRVIKEPTNPIDFYFKRQWIAEINAHVAIAHNRQPSAGVVAKENTHPFLSCDKSFALVHNGHNGSDIKLSYAHKIKGTTDSENITHALEELYLDTGDMVEALTALSNMSISGAILVLTKAGEIYGLKMGFNPIAYSETEKGVMIASTEEPIRLLVPTHVGIRTLRSKQIIRVKKGKVEIIGEGEEETFKLPKVWYGWDYFVPKSLMDYLEDGD